MRGATRMLDPPVQRPPVSFMTGHQGNQTKTQTVAPKICFPRQLRNFHALSPSLDEKRRKLTVTVDLHAELRGRVVVSELYNIFLTLNCNESQVLDYQRLGGFLNPG